MRCHRSIRDESSQADPDRTPAAPRDIPSTWVFLLPGTAQTSLRRLRPVPPEFDALFAAARTWDTLTSVSLPLHQRPTQNGGRKMEVRLKGRNPQSPGCDDQSVDQKD